MPEAPEYVLVAHPRSIATLTGRPSKDSSWESSRAFERLIGCSGADSRCIGIPVAGPAQSNVWVHYLESLGSRLSRYLIQ